MPKFNIESANVVLSGTFIEGAMIGLTSLQLKVYLLTRLEATKNQSVDFNFVATKLGVTATELEATINELCTLGIISKKDGVYTFVDGTLKVDQSALATQTTRPVVQDKALSELVALAQELLGKTLNSADSQTLFWICDDLGFSAEVVLMVIEHCVALNKRSMSYIEKVALEWHNQGVHTIEDVNRIIGEKTSNIEESKQNLKQLFQINDRDLSKLETEYIEKWLVEYNMSQEMISLAYEYCIIQLSKLSFPYMDGIISSWVSKNISTVEQAVIEHDNYGAKAQPEKPQPSTKKHGSTITNDDIARILELGK